LYLGEVGVRRQLEQLHLPLRRLLQHSCRRLARLVHLQSRRHLRQSRHAPPTALPAYIYTYRYNIILYIYITYVCIHNISPENMYIYISVCVCVCCVSVCVCMCVCVCVCVYFSGDIL
jgi:hypothetical protein